MIDGSLFRNLGGMLAVAVSLVLASCAPEPPVSEGGVHYVYSYFTGNGEDGLHLASSQDGMHCAR